MRIGSLLINTLNWSVKKRYKTKLICILLEQHSRSLNVRIGWFVEDKKKWTRQRWWSSKNVISFSLYFDYSHWIWRTYKYMWFASIHFECVCLCAMVGNSQRMGHAMHSGGYITYAYQQRTYPCTFLLHSFIFIHSQFYFFFYFHPILW